VKKILHNISASAFFLTFIVNASAASNTIPSATPGFSVSVTGLALQPSASNLDYAVYTHPLPITTPNWTQLVIKPGYTPAVDIGLQYNFADAATQVNLDWLYLSTSNSTSFSASGANSSVAPPYYFGPLAQALLGTSAKSSVQFQVSNVGVTLGHLINLGSHIQLDPFAGVSGGYLKQDLVSTYVGTDSSASPYSITSYNVSKFTGIGPRLGVNATYFITEHFGVSARFSTSLFAGVIRTNTNFSSFGAGNHIPVYTGLANQSENRVVPEFDSKLEMSYLMPMKGAQSSLSLAVGYLFSAYMNGINQVVPITLVPGAFNGGTLAIETTGQSQSNLDLNGPYASLIWKF